MLQPEGSYERDVIKSACYKVVSLCDTKIIKVNYELVWSCPSNVDLHVHLLHMWWRWQHDCLPQLAPGCPEQHTATTSGAKV